MVSMKDKGILLQIVKRCNRIIDYKIFADKYVDGTAASISKAIL